MYVTLKFNPVKDLDIYKQMIIFMHTHIITTTRSVFIRAVTDSFFYILGLSSVFYLILIVLLFGWCWLFSRFFHLQVPLLSFSELFTVLWSWLLSSCSIFVELFTFFQFYFSSSARTCYYLEYNNFLLILYHKSSCFTKCMSWKSDIRGNKWKYIILKS